LISVAIVFVIVCHLELLISWLSVTVCSAGLVVFLYRWWLHLFKCLFTLSCLITFAYGVYWLFAYYVFVCCYQSNGDNNAT